MAPTPLSRTFLLYHLHEAYSLQGKPHAAAAHLAAAGTHCSVWEAEDYKAFAGPTLGHAAALCGLVRAQSLGGNALLELGMLARIDRARELAIKHAPSNEERLYFEGRLFMTLPASEGRDLRKALVSLSMLERMRPSQAVRFWLARAHALNGNRSSAEEFLRPSPTVPKDSRSRLEEEAGLGLKNKEQAALDGYGFGFSPAFMFVTGAGLGASGTFYDERIADTARAARLTLSATTRGNLGVSTEATEAEWFRPVSIELGGQWLRRYEDFFTPGIASNGAATTHLAKRTSASVLLARPIVEPVYLKVGWRLEDDVVDVDPAVAFLPAGTPSATGSTTHGPVGEIGWDSRDSEADPFVGYFARMRGYFPSRELGSRLTFEQWNFDARAHLQPRVRHGIVLGVSLQHLAGTSAPFAAYPDFARSLSLPGTRVGRYRDRNAWGGFAEYRLALGSSFWLAGFGTVGSVAPQFARLWRETQKLGGGLAVLMRPSARRRLTTRVEGAVFGGEFVLTAGAGTSF